jgi:glutaredoxin
MSKTSAVFYHAGCPVCLDAESAITRYLDPTKVNLEVVHLGTAKNRLPEAEAAGVKSVPALVVDGQTIHLNFGAALSALK